MARTKHHGEQQKRKLYGADWWWYRTTPSAWTNSKMTRPQRVKTRNLLHKVRLLDDLENTPLFPLAKKPHVYYW